MHNALQPGRIKRKFKQVPYDATCEHIADDIPKRICKECGLYHSSIKAKIKHEAWCSLRNNQMAARSGLTQTTIPRVRPQRIAAIRQRERLVVLAHQEAEWINIDEVGMEGLDEPHENINSAGTPVIADEDRQVAWEEDPEVRY